MSSILPTSPRYLYIKHHKTKSNTYVQRIVPLKSVQWIEYDSVCNEMRIKMIGTDENEQPDVYKAETGTPMLDNDLVKRAFYDIVKDIRAEGKVIEGW
jgi:hypothetical protein